MFMETEVEAGIAFLNEKVPGWEDRINWETLDMGNHAECIGGQLGDDYFRWATEMGIYSEYRARGLGLNIAPVWEPGMSGEDERRKAIARYADLADTWKAKMGKVCVPA